MSAIKIPLFDVRPSSFRSAKTQAERSPQVGSGMPGEPMREQCPCNSMATPVPDDAPTHCADYTALMGTWERSGARNPSTVPPNPIKSPYMMAWISSLRHGHVRPRCGWRPVISRATVTYSGKHWRPLPRAWISPFILCFIFDMLCAEIRSCIPERSLRCEFLWRA